MGLKDIPTIEGQTPLDEDEKDALLLDTVTTRKELDEVEEQNIQKAIQWTLTRRRQFTLDEILSEAFVRELHRRMYGDVWGWAGEFRTTDKNIGVDKHQIGISLRMLLDDCRYWIENNVYSPDEIAIRFSHRIVAIHCFPNGNGRHSRLIADILIEKIFQREVFTWGGGNLVAAGDIRTAYLQAIRKADQEEYEPLIRFSRS
ncbi:MAG: mobile mystery protein B [Taibaiella sp.]|nr:mobile mystery protein B [Taibaiella sp.]